MPPAHCQNRDSTKSFSRILRSRIFWSRTLSFIQSYSPSVEVGLPRSGLLIYQHSLNFSEKVLLTIVLYQIPNTWTEAQFHRSIDMETRRGHAKEGQIHIYMRWESFSFLQGDYFGEASFSEDGSSDVNKCDWIETGFRQIHRWDRCMTQWNAQKKIGNILLKPSTTGKDIDTCQRKKDNSRNLPE